MAKQIQKLEPFDKSLEEAETILRGMIAKVKTNGKMEETEFKQKSELIRLVCNFHNYKTQQNYYLMAKTIKELTREQQSLLQQKLESL